MADILKMITAKRYIEGKERVCYYLGTYQTDGWIYFNDDIFWRHNPEFNVTHLLYLSKEVWCNTDNLEITNIGSLNGTQAQNVINGAGPAAPSAMVENAVQWAINKVTKIEFGKIKTAFDTSNVIIGGSLSLILYKYFKGIGLGTIFSGIVVGNIVVLYKKFLSNVLNKCVCK